MCQLPLEKFFEDFISCLKTLLLIGEKHATVEKALGFAAKFCVSFYDSQDNVEDHDGDDEDMPPFLEKKCCIFFLRPGTRIFGLQFASLSIRIRFHVFELRLLWSYSDFNTLPTKTVQLLKHLFFTLVLIQMLLHGALY